MINRLFRWVGLVVQHRRRSIAIVVLVILVAALFGASRITIATGPETFLSTDSQVYKDYARFNQEFSTDVIVVMVTGDDLTQLLQPANLQAMGSIESHMGAQPKVTSAISPTSVLMLAIAQQTGTPTLPEDIDILKAIVLDPHSGDVRTEFRSVLPDEKHALIYVVLKGGMPRDEQKEIVAETEEVVTDAGFTDVEAVVTGGPPLDARMEELIAKNMG